MRRLSSRRQRQLTGNSRISRLPTTKELSRSKNIINKGTDCWVSKNSEKRRRLSYANRNISIVRGGTFGRLHIHLERRKNRKGGNTSTYNDPGTTTAGSQGRLR